MSNDNVRETDVVSQIDCVWKLVAHSAVVLPVYILKVYGVVYCIFCVKVTTNTAPSEQMEGNVRYETLCVLEIIPSIPECDFRTQKVP